jgi:hypothetical protein
MFIQAWRSGSIRGVRVFVADVGTPVLRHKFDAGDAGPERTALSNDRADSDSSGGHVGRAGLAARSACGQQFNKRLEASRRCASSATVSSTDCPR